MADKQPAEELAKEPAIPTTSGSSRVADQQDQNNAAFARLFATLEGEKKKIKDLEDRRLRLNEEMKKLRSLLMNENHKLRLKVTPLKEVPIPSGKASSSSAIPSTSNGATTAPGIMKKASSSKSVTIAEPSSQKSVVPTSQSVGNLKKPKNPRSQREPAIKTKFSTKPKTVSNHMDLNESEQCPPADSFLQTLENQRHPNDEGLQNPREDLDEVLISLPALFNFMDAQVEQDPPIDIPESSQFDNPISASFRTGDERILNSSSETNDSSLMGATATPLIEAPAPLALFLPGTGISLATSDISECSANVDDLETL